jgi:lysophospholipase L1-like esterase
MKAIAALAIIGLASASEDNEFFKSNLRVQPVHHTNKTQEYIHHPIHHNKTHEIIRPVQILHNPHHTNHTVHPTYKNHTSHPVHKNHTIHPIHHTNKTQTHDLVHHKKKNLAFDDEELFKWDQLLQDGVKTYKDVKAQPRDFGAILNDAIQIVKDIKQHDDDELFNWKQLIHDGIQTYDDVHSNPKNYGNILNDVIKVVKDIKQHDDDELFYSKERTKFPDLINHVARDVQTIIGDGKNLIKDVKNKDIAHLIKEGIKTYKDIKQHDDEELYSLKQLIHDGIYTYDDVRIKSYQNDDNELFNLKQLIHDGIKTYDDVHSNPKNYGNILNDVIKVVKDIKQHDDNEFFSFGLAPISNQPKISGDNKPTAKTFRNFIFGPRRHHNDD